MGGGWWVEVYWQHDKVHLIAWIFWLFLSIILHELAHGFAAIRCGDRTPIELGHMTWNPVVHMGKVSLIAFAIFGLAWGAMPVNPSRFRGYYDDFKVAGAGPAVNIGLAVITGITCGLWIALAGGWVFESIHVPDTLYTNIQTFLNVGCSLNVVLVILNLLPIPPLDGSRMLANLSPAYNRLLQHPHAQGIGMLCFAAVFFYGAQYLWAAGHWANGVLVDGVLRVLAPGAM